jgi:D-alanyl-D-alanine dipeptidase
MNTKQLSTSKMSKAPTMYDSIQLITDIKLEMEYLIAHSVTEHQKQQIRMYDLVIKPNIRPLAYNNYYYLIELFDDLLNNPTLNKIQEAYYKAKLGQSLDK